MAFCSYCIFTKCACLLPVICGKELEGWGEVCLPWQVNPWYLNFDFSVKYYSSEHPYSLENVCDPFF